MKESLVTSAYLQKKKIHSVSIIGCGWLGTALAKELVASGVNVVVTTQTASKVAELSSLGLNTQLLTLPLRDESQVNAMIFDSEILLIAIPPQLKQGKKDYPEKIAQLVRLAKQGQVKKIILLNSTAIYTGLTGEVSETAQLQLQHEKVAIFNQAEQVVLQSGLACVVLRLAGLVGPKRHPGRFFNKQKSLANAEHYINLVHQMDVVNCITALMAAEQVTGIFNLASQTKVSKQAFYTQAAKSLGLPAASVSTSAPLTNDQGKLINSSKLRAAINCHFKYDDLLQWLAQEKAE